MACIRDDPDGILLQVQDASSQEQAAIALAKARSDILSMDDTDTGGGGIAFASQVVMTPNGPALFVDGGSFPEDSLLGIPDIVLSRLREVGVNDAVITSPEATGDLSDLAWVPRAVIMHLYPALRQEDSEGLHIGRLPSTWLPEAVAWVTARLAQSELLSAEAMLQFPIGAEDALEALERSRRAGSGKLVAGSPTSTIRGVQASFIGSQCLSLAAGGPSATDDLLLAEMESLVELARSLADELVYAFATIEPSFARFACTTAASRPPRPTRAQHCHPASPAQVRPPSSAYPGGVVGRRNGGSSGQSDPPLPQATCHLLAVRQKSSVSVAK